MMVVNKLSIYSECMSWFYNTHSVNQRSKCICTRHTQTHWIAGTDPRPPPTHGFALSTTLYVCVCVWWWVLIYCQSDWNFISSYFSLMSTLCLMRVNSTRDWCIPWSIGRGPCIRRSPLAPAQWTASCGQLGGGQASVTDDRWIVHGILLVHLRERGSEGLALCYVSSPRVMDDCELWLSAACIRRLVDVVGGLCFSRWTVPLRWV